MLAREGLSPTERLGEINVEVPGAAYLETCGKLRDHADLRFEQCMDLTGIDYAAYADKPRQGPRFAVALQLLSITHNWRLRLRTFCPDDEAPLLPSLCEVWPSSTGTSARRSISSASRSTAIPTCAVLTDYGFIGHPFRKDFPVSGHVEMRCDPEQKRGLPAGDHRSARGHAAHRARGPLRRGPRPRCLRSATTR